MAEGFTLIELMIGLALGSMALALTLKTLAQGRAAWQTAENLAALDERAAFALTALERDVLLAGYWVAHADASRLRVAANVSIHCQGRDVTTASLASTNVHASNGLFDLPCPAASGAVAGSDTLTVRHAEAATTSPEAGRVQLCTSAVDGDIFQDGLRPVACGDEQQVHNVQVHSWYVNKSSSEQGLPALYRYTLVSGGLLQNQEIMPGVENLQVTLGVDRDADGMIDGFIDPGTAPDARILAVRLWILLRTAQPEPAHIDNGPWYSIDSATTAPLRPHDHYRRTTAERIIWLRNNSEG